MEIFPKIILSKERFGSSHQSCWFSPAFPCLSTLPPNRFTKKVTFPNWNHSRIFDLMVWKDIPSSTYKWCELEPHPMRPGWPSRVRVILNCQTGAAGLERNGIAPCCSLPYRLRAILCLTECLFHAGTELSTFTHSLLFGPHNNHDVDYFIIPVFLDDEMLKLRALSNLARITQLISNGASLLTSMKRMEKPCHGSSPDQQQVAEAVRS